MLPPKPDDMAPPDDGSMPTMDDESGEPDPEAISSALDQMSQIIDDIQSKLVLQRKKGPPSTPPATGA